MRKLSFICAALALAPEQVSAQTTQPDVNETFGVALALGDKCQTYRGFEYLYVSDLFQSAYRGSALAQAKQAAVQQKAGGTGREKKEAAAQVEREFSERYRQKADKLGCDGGLQTMQTALFEAYKEIGAVLALVNAQQGGAAVQSPLEPLTDLERGLIEVFYKAVSDMLGAQMPQFDQAIAGLAQLKAGSFGTSSSEMYKGYTEARDKAFKLIHHEALVTGAGWQLSGARVTSRNPYASNFGIDSEFGYYTMRATKPGAPTLTLLAEPMKLETQANVGGTSQRFNGYVSIGIRDDGTIIAAVAGGNIDAAPQTLVINAATDAGFAANGKPTADGCPYTRCYAFTLEEAKRFANQGTTKFGLANNPQAGVGIGFVNAPEVTSLRLKPIVDSL